MASKIMIDKLSGRDNWASWKVQMLNILECEEVIEVVNGEYKAPATGD